MQEVEKHVNKSLKRNLHFRVSEKEAFVLCMSKSTLEHVFLTAPDETRAERSRVVENGSKKEIK